MRARSATYRRFEPLVCGVAAHLGRLVPGPVATVGRALDALAEDDWRPAEYVAARLLQLAPVVALAVAVAGWMSSVEVAAGVALLAVLAGPLLVASETRSRAARRVTQLRARLPYTLDLMALVLEAGGGTLFDCLRLGAVENPGHPLGDEFRRVVQGIEQGAPPGDALADVSRRLADPDVAEVALAIATSESRGLPLKDGLRSVATRLRSRRVQWLERASEQAKVHITWPAMVTMVACLLIIVAPVVIGALNGEGGAAK